MVCIVDDDPPLLRALDRLISSFGFDVQTFQSAIEYLNWIEGKRPSCLVLDVVMPRMSGFQLLTALDDLGKSIPAILVSGREIKFFNDQAVSIVAYLKKPFDTEALHSAIKQAVVNYDSAVDSSRPPADRNV